MVSRLRPPLMTLLLLIASACSSEPKGQVVATIDGEEITERELRAELRAHSLDNRAALDPSVRTAALEDVIDRKLLARAAKAAGIDRRPEFQAAMIRQREQMLASLLLEQGAISNARPTPAEIAARIAAKPWRYRERAMLLAERAGEPGSAAVVDSAELSEKAAETLTKAPLGVAIDIEERGEAMSLVIRRRWPVELNAEEAAGLAAADLRAERAEGDRQRLLAGLRGSAAIRRQTSADRAR